MRGYPVPGLQIKMPCPFPGRAFAVLVFVFDVVIDVVVRLVAFILGVGRRDDVVDKVQGVCQLFAVFLVVPGGVAEVPDAEVIPAVAVPFQLGGAEAL